MGTGEGIDAALLPGPVQGVGAAGGALIGTDPVQAAHEQVPIYQGPGGVQDQGYRKPEARGSFHAVGVEGDDRNVRQPRLIQSPADEAHVVAGPAAAAGLGHEDGQVIGVILPGGNGAHDLPHHGDGGKQASLLTKFEPHVDGCPVVIIQDYHVVSMAPEHRLQEGEMNGAHLGRQNGLALLSICRVNTVRRYGTGWGGGTMPWRARMFIAASKRDPIRRPGCTPRQF